MFDAVEGRRALALGLVLLPTGLAFAVKPAVAAPTDVREIFARGGRMSVWRSTA